MKPGYLQRLFVLAFIALSLMPLVVLLYLYLQYDTESSIAVPMPQFRLLIVVIGITSLLLFFFLRSQFGRVAHLSGKIKKALTDSVEMSSVVGLTKEEGEVSEIARTFNEIITRLEENIRELQDTQNTLYVVLTKVGKALTSPHDFDFFINLILETAVDSLGATQGALFSFGYDGGIELVASTGFDEAQRAELAKADHPLIHRAVQERRLIAAPDGGSESKKGAVRLPLISSPLISREKSRGVLLLSGRRKGGDFSAHDGEIVEGLSRQLAIALENLATDKDMEKTHFETVAALALAVEAKDAHSRGHSERVGEYATLIGDTMGLSDREIATLQEASRLHDIGKIGVADRILNKPGSLTPDERELIRQHTIIGESIVKPLKSYEHLLAPLRHHHEFLDGSGYPDALRGDAISPLTRVLTVADIFDAITSDRSYRKGMGLPKVKKELTDMVSAGKLDGGVVDALFRAVDSGRLTVKPLRPRRKATSPGGD